MNNNTEKLDFQETYSKIKPQIINGTISKQEATNLYDSCQGMNKSTIDKEVLNDLKQNGMNSEKLHNFVSTLIEVEIDKMNQRFTEQNQKRNEYMRNTSLAKTALLYECVENRLGVIDIYPFIKKIDITKEQKQELSKFTTDRKGQDFSNNEIIEKDNKKIDEFKEVSNGQIGKSIKAFQDFKVPDYLQDHMSKGPVARDRKI